MAYCMIHGNYVEQTIGGCPQCVSMPKFVGALPARPAVPQGGEGQGLNQRGWDLLRQMRHNLHNEQLISDEEYAYLVAEVQGSVKRLEDYDKAVAALRLAGAPQEHVFKYEAGTHVAKCSCGWTMEGVGQQSGWDFFRQHLKEIK